MRIILDTNVLIAAILPPARASADRAPACCLERALSCGNLLMSDETLGELARVLGRPDFDRRLAPGARMQALTAIIRRAERRTAVPPVKLCRDPEDDKFFALAIAGAADWLVSMDKRVLAIRSVGCTHVARPQRFLAATACPG